MKKILCVSLLFVCTNIHIWYIIMNVVMSFSCYCLVKNKTSNKTNWKTQAYAHPTYTEWIPNIHNTVLLQKMPCVGWQKKTHLLRVDKYIHNSFSALKNPYRITAKASGEQKKNGELLFAIENWDHTSFPS